MRDVLRVEELERRVLEELALIRGTRRCLLQTCVSCLVLSTQLQVWRPRQFGSILSLGHFSLEASRALNLS